jgi:trehalose 6-phosphate phosphatase
MPACSTSTASSPTPPRSTALPGRTCSTRSWQRAKAQAPFTDDDYYRFVDGRPRYEGVRTFLESRRLDLPYGDPDDPPERDTICGLGNRKNEAFNRRLAQGGVEVFDNSVRLIHMIKAHGLKTALVTSSRNAEAVLAAAGIKPLFDAVVDGNEAIRQNLKGKPHPDTYRHALEVLGVEPARAFGIEDATSGVESIRAAGYGLVVGVDRAGQRQALLDHGADIVVRDLGELQFSGTGSEPDLPDALDRFDDLARMFAERKPAIFLDYDGTLTPIVSRPELAVLDGPMRATLAELAEVFPPPSSAAATGPTSRISWALTAWSTPAATASTSPAPAGSSANTRARRSSFRPSTRPRRC